MFPQISLSVLKQIVKKRREFLDDHKILGTISVEGKSQNWHNACYAGDNGRFHYPSQKALIYKYDNNKKAELIVFGLLDATFTNRAFTSVSNRDYKAIISVTIEWLDSEKIAGE